MSRIKEKQGKPFLDKPKKEVQYIHSEIIHYTKSKGRHMLLLRWISGFKDPQDWESGRISPWMRIWFSYEQEAKVYCYIHFAYSPETLMYFFFKQFSKDKHLVRICHMVSCHHYDSLATGILCYCFLFPNFAVRGKLREHFSVCNNILYGQCTVHRSYHSKAIL